MKKVEDNPVRATGGCIMSPRAFVLFVVVVIVIATVITFFNNTLI